MPASLHRARPADQRSTILSAARNRLLSQHGDPMRFAGAIRFLAPALGLLAAPPGYHVIATYTIGGPGGWDYVAFDTVGHRLFIARQTRVLVINPETGASLGEIPGINGAHGTALADA